AKRLCHGKNLMYLLRQEQYRPLAQYEQVIILIAAMENVFDSAAPEDVPALKYEVLEYVKEKLGDVCRDLEASGKLSDEQIALIAETAKEYTAGQSNV
ncbi:MAG: hypothetical protein IKZ59_03700, partial [Clostridia bacterium]|nr:hypothetical protein [Clostridia bacterium]